MAMTTTTRTGDPGHNFTEQTLGETPCSVSFDMNAKGQAQLSIKLTYASPADIRTQVADELWAAIAQAKLALEKAGIPLAGQSGTTSSAAEGK